MRKYFDLLCLFLLFVLNSFAADEINTVGSSIKSVTVYRNGAELVHTAKANLKQGSNELSIEGISNSIDINSLQINCPSAITILGVEFSNQYLLSEVTSPAVKKIMDSVETVRAELEKINISLATT